MDEIIDAFYDLRGALAARGTFYRDETDRYAKKYKNAWAFPIPAAATAQFAADKRNELRANADNIKQISQDYRVMLRQAMKLQERIPTDNKVVKRNSYWNSTVIFSTILSPKPIL